MLLLWPVYLQFYGLGDPKTYFKMILHLVAGDILDRNKIKSRLTELQYERNDTELRRGTFSVKGEIIDIFPADSEKDALRVELFDNEIENLYVFDPLTGSIVKKKLRDLRYTLRLIM